MSPRDERRPPTRAVFLLFSNGLLTLCVLVLAAVVLWQNWPRDNPPNDVHLAVARAESVTAKPTRVLAKRVLERHRVGDEVGLTVRRDQQQREIRVRLEDAE